MENYLIYPLTLPTGERIPVDVPRIRSFMAKGIRDCDPIDRAAAWLVLSEVFPSTGDDWTMKRNSYVKFYQEYIKAFGLTDFLTLDVPNTCDSFDFGVESNSTMELIHNDITRSHHHTKYLPLIEGEIVEEGSVSNSHLRRLERILYIFAKSNVGLGYSQGFNELVCPIYYVFSCALDYCLYSWDVVETLTYFVFQYLLGTTDLKDFHTMVDNASILYHRVISFSALIEEKLPYAHQIITEFDIHPLVFALSRLGLMFSQEMEIPELVVLWDVFFANIQNLGFTLDLYGVAHISLVEELLNPDDKNATMIALKKTTVASATRLIEAANALLKKPKRGFFQKLFH